MTLVHIKNYHFLFLRLSASFTGLRKYSFLPFFHNSTSKLRYFRKNVNKQHASKRLIFAAEEVNVFLITATSFPSFICPNIIILLQETMACLATLTFLNS
jgi:hypothetical protein